MTHDDACHPHGISRIDVFDPEAFKRWSLLHTPPIPTTSNAPAHPLPSPSCGKSRLLPRLTTPLRRSARLRWFHRADIAGEAEPTEPVGRQRELENSVNQAFRRCAPPCHRAPDPGSRGPCSARSGLIPERKPKTRGYDWDGGRVWTFDRATYAKVCPPPPPPSAPKTASG